MLVSNATTVVKCLKNQQIGIIPTDTIYGVVCRCVDTTQIARIYQIKQRAYYKNPIILVANWKQLQTVAQVESPIRSWWKNQTEPTTLILKQQSNFPYRNKLFWLGSTVAVRWVQWPWLQRIIRQTGPIIATSCNYSQKAPLTNWNDVFNWAKTTKMDFIIQKPAQSQQMSRILDWQRQVYRR